jgi:hypothetical protein
MCVYSLCFLFHLLVLLRVHAVKCCMRLCVSVVSLCAGTHRNVAVHVHDYACV